MCTELLTDMEEIKVTVQEEDHTSLANTRFAWIIYNSFNLTNMRRIENQRDLTCTDSDFRVQKTNENSAMASEAPFLSIEDPVLKPLSMVLEMQKHSPALSMLQLMLHYKQQGLISD